MIHQTEQTIAGLDCQIVSHSEVSQPQGAVILCHGFGAPGTDLVSIGKELITADRRLADAVYFFPAAPIVLDPMLDGRAWWMIDIEAIQELAARGESRKMRTVSPPELPARRESLIALIDEVRRQYRLSASQVVVGGFSQGSMLATDVALHYPEALGGLIVWSGALINETVWRDRAQQQDRLRVVQTHGVTDPILPISGARDLCQMLQSTGHEVRYHEFDGPHTIPMEGLVLAAQLIGEVMGSKKVPDPMAGKGERA